MAEGHQPPRGCTPLTAARRKQDRRHHHERKLSGGEIAEGDGLDADLSKRHQRTTSGGPEGGRAQGMREEQAMATAREIDPFLKADLPTRPPRSVTGKVSPDVLQGSYPMTRGPGPTCHTD
jgi:hypothetical protein